jgi:hypothetical protein
VYPPQCWQVYSMSIKFDAVRREPNFACKSALPIKKKHTCAALLGDVRPHIEHASPATARGESPLCSVTHSK